MRLPSRAVTLLAVAALPLAALTACSSGSSSGSGASAKPANADPDAGLLTGAQLKKALAPASAFPAGYAAAKGADADTGKSFQSQDVKAMGKPDCTRLEATAWIALTGASGVSFAQNGYSTKSEEMDQEIDEFRGTTAKLAMQRVRSLATTCASFVDPQDHTKVTVKGQALPGLGDEAYTMTLTSPVWSGTTLVAVREGTAVISTLSSRGPDNGAASAKKLAEQLTASLKSAVTQQKKAA